MRERSNAPREARLFTKRRMIYILSEKNEVVIIMALFSERYGYTKPSEVLIREEMTQEIENAICSSFDILNNYLIKNFNGDVYKDLELYLWTDFLNERYNDFYSDYGGHMIVATHVLKSKDYEWFLKLDLVEKSVKWLYAMGKKNQGIKITAGNFTSKINHEFERLNYAYRFVDTEIVELTNEQEIKSIETCLATSGNNVRMHMSTALELISERPVGKYSNSIKESISAVEAVCREITGEKDLGRALDCLIKKGVVIPQSLKNAFNKLYDYTNDKETGIRHALMDESGEYKPTYAEALFMLVSCSAFVNYINGKSSQ